MSRVRGIDMEYRVHSSFPNYKIYENGDVCGTDGAKKRLEKTIHDRYRIDLYANGKRKRFQLHRLVALLFIPNKDNKPEINHKDGNPLNNHIDNLEWCTRSENIQHSYDELGRVSELGWGNGKTLFSDEQISDMRNRSNNGQTYKSIARFFSCSATYVSDVVNGKRRAILGYAPTHE